MIRKISLLIILTVILVCNVSEAGLLFRHKEDDKAKLLLTTEAILSENNIDKIDKDRDVFYAGERIYFHTYVKNGFKSNLIKYQIVKQDDNAHIGGYSRIRSKVKRVKNKNYDSEYFILFESGKYLVQIFNIEDLHHWIGFKKFTVVNE